MKKLIYITLVTLLLAACNRDKNQIILRFDNYVNLSDEEFVENIKSRVSNSIGPMKSIDVKGQTVTLSFENDVTKIGKEAFFGYEALTSITIPNTVTEIGEEAFNGCTSLTFITIPSSLTKIGRKAFYDTSLTTITIPNSVTEIWENAFYRCTFLTSIYIPNSVAEIGEGTFGDCRSLKAAKIPKRFSGRNDIFPEYTNVEYY